MKIRGRISWGDASPLSGPRFADLEAATAAVADGAVAITAEQKVARVTLTIQRADVALRIAEATSPAEEQAAQKQLGIEIKEFMKIKSLQKNYRKRFNCLN